MATNYFYKEVVDDTDPDKKNPIRLDTLFLPKIRAGDDIPDEDRTKYVDTGRDLAGYFEKHDPEKYVRSYEVLKEASNFYVGDAPGEEITDLYNVIGDLGKGAVIGEVTINHDKGPTAFPIPPQYQNRRMFWSFYFKELEACSGGGFTEPGQTEVTGWAVAHYNEFYHFEMQLHEVEILEGIPENDLALRYAAPKDSVIPWWKIAAFTPKGLYSGITSGNYRDIPGAPYYGCVYKWAWGMKRSGGSHYSGIKTRTKVAGDLTYKVNGSVVGEGRAMVGIVGPYIPEEPDTFKEES